jgi:hypothetical protein
MGLGADLGLGDKVLGSIASGRSETGPMLLLEETGPMLLLEETGPMLLLEETGPMLLLEETGPMLLLEAHPVMRTRPRPVVHPGPINHERPPSPHLGLLVGPARCGRAAARLGLALLPLRPLRARHVGPLV